MRSTITQRIAIAFLALFMLVFAVFQAYRYFSSPYKTEAVYYYTVADTDKVRGMILRDEIVIQQQVSDSLAYSHPNGTKVMKDAPVAEIYSSEQDAQNFRTLRSLEHEIELLQKSNDPASTSFSYTDVLNKQIFEQLGNVIDTVNTGNVSEITDTRDKLLVLMNSKCISTGQVESFDERIAYLTAEKEYCESRITQEENVVKAPETGYFSHISDGYESRVSTADVGELSLNRFDELMMGEQQVSPESLGKIVTNHNWYLVADIPASNVKSYPVGGLVDLDLHLPGVPVVSATIAAVTEEENADRCLVYFKSDWISGKLLEQRVVSADVKFKVFTGLRVNNDAVRFIETQKGVYVTVGDKMMFKPITTIYEGVGFVLCAEEVPINGKPALQLFDEAIVEGKDLYDGKPLKR